MTRKQKSQNDKMGIHQVSDVEELWIIVFTLETLMEIHTFICIYRYIYIYIYISLKFRDMEKTLS